MPTVGGVSRLSRWLNRAGTVGKPVDQRIVGMSTSPARRPLARRLSILASFRGPSRVLYLTTLAFFLSFVVWFDMAPFAVAIGDDLGLDKSQLVTLTLCNLALTVPARVVVGAVLDRVGPRRLYAGLLVFAAVPNTMFALSESFSMLVVSRLLLGIVGAGFVVGIRMVSEWFSREDIGTAEGIYGGWGNFGSAAAALVLPPVAAAVAGGVGGWRWGVGIAGVAAAVYGVVYWFAVTDTPEGVTYARPARKGALPVSSRGALIGLLAMQVPVAAILGVVALRIHRVGVLSETGLWIAYATIAAYTLWQVALILKVNRPVLEGAAPDHEYEFRAVALLSLAYGVTFGAELAVVSLLPTFFSTTFGLAIGAASAAGSAFAFTNLVTRPGGGIWSDLSSSRGRVVRGCLFGTAVSFAVLSFLDGGWPLALGIGLVALASVFVQGGNGAVFAMVPQIHKPVSGQIAGLAGCYGNVGGIAFSSVLFFWGDDARLLFLTVAAAALFVGVVCRWLPHMAGAGRTVDVPEVPTPATAVEPAVA
jgi:NNP family nitrate/nitrite transporter-like MFS transporter